MHSNRALRASVLSVLLVLGSFTAFIVPTVGAEPSDDRTDLYFTEYSTIISDILFPSEEDDYYGDDLFGNITSQMSTIRPTEEKDSIWLPRLFIDNESRIILPDPNLEKYLELVLMFVVFNNPDLVKNFTQGDPLLESLIDQIDFQLINPFRINEDFTYNGKESVELNGKIIFDLYLSSESKIFRKDNIKVSISTTSSILGMPISSEEIKNVTATIKPSILPNIVKKQQIELDLSNESILVEPGDTLRFSVELIPHERDITLLKIAEKIGFGGGEWLENRAEELKNKYLPIRQKIGENISLILDLLNISIDETISIQLLDLISLSDLSELKDAIQGSSFLFASASHPSRVILPVDMTSGEDNIKTFYLHEGNQMDELAPTSESKTLELTENTIPWNTSGIQRNKIIKEATVALYINARNFRPLTSISISAALVSEGNTLANASVEITDRLLLTPPNEPLIITFNNINQEIFYEEAIGLKLSTAAPLKIGQKVELQYDSPEYASSVTITLDETDNIQFEISSDPEDELIIPGGELQYTLSIESLYDDEIDLDISDEKNGDWSYSIVESLPISISAGETEEINVIVKSENNQKEAYGDTLDLTFEVSGTTGYGKKMATVVVDEAAVEYNIGIYGQDESKNIKKGNSGTFYFVIENKNTGAIDDEDTYTITDSTKNDWELKFTDSTPSLVIGEKTDSKRIFVKVYVPENTTIDSDVITVTVTSDNNPEAIETINVTVNVLQLSIFENIVELFKSAANSLGLDDMFGSKAPYVLAGILAILIVLIILILIFLLRRKSVKIICTDRIQEIDPSEEAVFDITLNNPTRKTKTYEITSKVSPESSKWQTATDVEKIPIAARSSKQILLVAKPEETVESNDWTEVKLNVSVSGKKKSEEITTMVMAKDGKTLLRIKDVFSWPREFKKGDRIITSFILENKGHISARNVKVVLFINGKQKNKVEVTIPRGGYAEIKIPWIALKGKNELQLKAIEQ